MVNLLHETEEPSRTGSTFVQARLAGEPRQGPPTNIQPTAGSNSPGFDEAALDNLLFGDKSPIAANPNPSASNPSTLKTTLPKKSMPLSSLTSNNSNAGFESNFDSNNDFNSGTSSGVVLGGGNKIRLSSLANPSNNSTSSTTANNVASSNAGGYGSMLNTNNVNNNNNNSGFGDSSPAVGGSRYVHMNIRLILIILFVICSKPSSIYMM